MHRREFLGVLGGAATAAWPLAARAQQAVNIPTVGFMLGGSAASQRTWADAFVQGLRQFGWIEGRTIAIEYRWAEGRPDRTGEFAAEFVRRKVNVIVSGGTEGALAAKQATQAIPIVFAVAGDPVGTGLVTSLARPGGNVTGLSNFSIDLAAKRLELLREVMPELKRLAVLANANYSGAGLELGEIKTAAGALRLELLLHEMRRADDVASAFESLKGRAEAVYVVGDAFASAHRIRISTFALAARLPTMCGQRDYIEVGGLMSYGPNFPDLNRRAAGYVDKILRGAKPADLPVELPIKFDLVVNLITAQALGVVMPRTLIGRADEVIE
jgi:putative ABC transport system substrate-binding protein